MGILGFLAMNSSARIWTMLTMVSEPLTWSILPWARSREAPKSMRATSAMAINFIFIAFSPFFVDVFRSS